MKEERKERIKNIMVVVLGVIACLALWLVVLNLG